IATFKYDEYQQFSAGMRFVESLALWLSQFDRGQERQIAYDFVMQQLVFCSADEMSHLVGMAYADYIRPLLLRNTAADIGLTERRLARVAADPAFERRRRQCLFLGLSDGAWIDVFRRVNGDEISNEQVWQTYDLSKERVEDLLRKLQVDLGCGTDRG